MIYLRASENVCMTQTKSSCTNGSLSCSLGWKSLRRFHMQIMTLCTLWYIQSLAPDSLGEHSPSAFIPSASLSGGRGLGKVKKVLIWGNCPKSNAFRYFLYFVSAKGMAVLLPGRKGQFFTMANYILCCWPTIYLMQIVNIFYIYILQLLSRQFILHMVSWTSFLPLHQHPSYNHWLKHLSLFITARCADLWCISCTFMVPPLFLSHPSQDDWLKQDKTKI